MTSSEGVVFFELMDLLCTDLVRSSEERRAPHFSLLPIVRIGTLMLSLIASP